MPRGSLDSVLATLDAGRVIRVMERESLGVGGTSVEDLLASVVRARPVLLHGTGNIVQSGSPLRLSPGRGQHGAQREKEGFATDLPSVAMLKALFSNQGFNLRYPWIVSPDTPLQLTIEGWRPEAERAVGYVHVVAPRDSFKRDRNTWQWITSREDVRFGGCVEVERADFSYPVIRKPEQPER